MAFDLVSLLVGFGGGAAVVAVIVVPTVNRVMRQYEAQIDAFRRLRSQHASAVACLNYARRREDRLESEISKLKAEIAEADWIPSEIDI